MVRRAADGRRTRHAWQAKPTAGSTSTSATRLTKATAPTLGDFAPLYQAIAHGCRARPSIEKLLNDIHHIASAFPGWKPDGRPASIIPPRMLGATGSDLAAMSWFFQQTVCGPRLPHWKLHRTLMCPRAFGRLCDLRAQGRFGRGHCRLSVAGLADRRGSQDSWGDASLLAPTNVSDGRVATSVEVALAVQMLPQLTPSTMLTRSTDQFVKTLAFRTSHAAAPCTPSGQVATKRSDCFADSRASRHASNSGYPHSRCCSLCGVMRYCDLLLARADWQPSPQPVGGNAR